jgi:CIC family chloride channel protein
MNRPFFAIRESLLEHLSRLKRSDYILMTLLAALIGVGGGFGAIGFRYLIRLAQFIAFQTWTFRLEVAQGVPWYILIVIPAAGLLIIYPLVTRLAPETKGHGVPEVMEAVALRGGVIRPRIVIVKAVASAICIGTGGSVGREGPIVQIGSAFGSVMGQLLRFSAARIRTLVGCGAAAGIAGTFNAPIAGSLFAAEVILGDFGVPQFSPVVISSVISTIICRHYLGDMPAFIVPRYELVSHYELFPYALLGLLAGFIGVTFSRFVYRTEDFFDELKIPGFIKPLLGGVLVGALGIWFPHVLGVGYDAIDLALAQKMSGILMLGLIGAKLAATSLSLGAGGSGGIFAPSLFLGAMTGGFLGSVVHHFLPSITAGAGAYATVGMGAVVAAATHAPLTAMIIIFEMTGDYQIIPPLMAACVISTIVALRMKPSSIYTEKLLRRGIRLFEPLELNVLKKVPVSHAITNNPVTVKEGAGFQELMNLLVNSSRSRFFVVGDKNEYLGTISIHQLRNLLRERELLNPLIIARDLMDSTYPTLRPDDQLDLAMKLFAQEHISELPVISGNKLVGSVRRSNVMEEYHRELTKRDLSGSFQGALTCVARTKCVDLGEGYMMAEVEVPSHFIGKTLRELDLRSHEGVEIILIRQTKKGSKGITVVASPDHRFSHGEVLLIAGEEEKVRRATA